MRHFRLGLLLADRALPATVLRRRIESSSATTSTSRTCSSTSSTRWRCGRLPGLTASAALSTLARAARTEAALLERCYDERTGLFYRPPGRSERRVEVSTWSSLAPLALDAIPEHVRRRLVEEHLLHPRRYFAQLRDPVGRARGADLQARVRVLAVLARTVVDQHRMAARPGDARARIQRGSRAGRAARWRWPWTGTGLASTTTRSPGGASRRSGFGFSTLIVDLLAQSGIEPGRAVRP